jgi:hypothetical protein
VSLVNKKNDMEKIVYLLKHTMMRELLLELGMIMLIVIVGCYMYEHGSCYVIFDGYGTIEIIESISSMCGMFALMGLAFIMSLYNLVHGAKQFDEMVDRFNLTISKSKEVCEKFDEMLEREEIGSR